MSNDRLAFPTLQPASTEALTETTTLSGVLAEVAAERRRQIEVEGWTTEHDDKHDAGQIAAAGAAYAQHAAHYGDYVGDVYRSWGIPGVWPWDKKWWKPKDCRRDLIRAAALIVAEVERLDRSRQSGEARS